MKRIIRNLLVGIIPFFPSDKVNAEQTDEVMPEVQEEVLRQITDAPSSNEYDKVALEKILKGEIDHKGPLAGTQQVQDLLDLIAEEEQRMTNEEVKADFEIKESILDHSSKTPSTNTLFSTTVKDHLSPEIEKEIPTNSVVSVEIPLTNKTEQVSQAVSSSAQALKLELPDVKTNALVSSTEVPLTSGTEQTTQEVSSIETNVPVSYSSKPIQKDLEDLLNTLDKEEEIGSRKKETKDLPISERPWFPYAFSVCVSFFLVGGLWLANKVERYSRRKKNMQWAKKIQSLADQSEDIKNAQNPVQLQKEEKVVAQSTVSVPETEKKKRKTTSKKIVSTVSEFTEEDPRGYQRGVRMLANIKIRRAALNRQKKALLLEKETAYLSESRRLEIEEELEKITDERNQLTQMKRQASMLVKGKQGKLIKDERRLCAKEMRLAKKSPDAQERIAKIQAKREEIKAREKELIKSAEAEAKERMETANWWHGKRLYLEAKEKEEALNQKIKKLKKETGLKKREILEIEDELRTALKQVQREKKIAIQQMKGRKFTTERRLLRKQIAEARSTGNTQQENQIIEKLNATKEKEKEYIEWSKNFDYVEGKRVVIPYKVAEHAIRRDRANQWKGYRMLRDLREGLVESVSSNQITAQEYEIKALALIGKLFDPSFNYEEKRATALKPTTLGHIYLSKKERGLI